MPQLVDTSFQNDSGPIEVSPPTPEGRAERARDPDRPITTFTLEVQASPAFTPVQLMAYREDLVRRAMSLTRGDRSRAQDLVQDTFERAIQHVGRLAPGSTLRGWLYVIMSHRFLDLARLECKHRVEPLEQEVAGQEDEDVAPWWETITHDQLRAALVHLAPELRATFEQREFHQASYVEIANTLKVPVATVGTRLCRARVQLRKLLSATCAPEVNQ
jgi:RNA polymerase sigma-70 factor (ECF subfamily)